MGCAHARLHCGGVGGGVSDAPCCLSLCSTRTPDSLSLRDLESALSSGQVDVADTVGCGDSFAAAVALGFTRGHRIPPLLALANAVGAATAMGSGAGVGRFGCLS